MNENNVRHMENFIKWIYQLRNRKRQLIANEREGKKNSNEYLKGKQCTKQYFSLLKFKKNWMK